MKHPEHDLHKAVAQFLDAILDHSQVVWSSIGHGGFKLSPQAAARMKATGILAGLPDITILARNRPAHWIELKAPGKYPEPHQRALHARLKALGCLVAVCRSVDEVEGVLAAWEIPMRGRIAA